MAIVTVLSLLLVSNLSHASSEGVSCVVLLHGLARTSASMKPLENALSKEGYFVANIDYPSRSASISELAGPAIEDGLTACPKTADEVHFVTHSLGGILIRYYLESSDIERLGRVVMIGPPNQGSEVVDTYRNVPGYRLLNGPAGLELGTDEQSTPARLGPVSFPLGVIAGTKTFNPILSLSLPNPDDGKVSVEKTKVEGMHDFIAVPHTHTFMMRAPLVLEQTVHFLKHGVFLHDDASNQ